MRVSTSIQRVMCQTVSRTLLPRSSARHSRASSSRPWSLSRTRTPTSSNHLAINSVSRMARVYGVPMADDRRRPLRDEEVARIAHAIDPRARAIRIMPILGGLDAATYALDLDVAGETRELVVRICTLPEQRDGVMARRYWDAISGIPAAASLPIPRGVHLDADGSLVGLPCLVMTRVPGTPLARPANEDDWIYQPPVSRASCIGVDMKSLPPSYRRGVAPADLVEEHLRSAPRIFEELWYDVAEALRSAAPAPAAHRAALTHHDFWFGNTLWSGERLTGIVDWDGARIDDPGFDVGYARLDM